MLRELEPREGGVYLDGTLGGAGYTRALAERVGSAGVVIALDRDPTALERARERLGSLAPRVRLVHANFADGADVAREQGFERLDGVVLDLGLSSEQLDDPARGLSFDTDAVPDMRMDRTSGRPASWYANNLEERELARVLADYGEEPRARTLARRIVNARPIETCRQLAAIAEGLYRGPSRVHPATRLFQALRILVNDELGALDRALAEFPAMLAPGGRFAVVSFHSLEDRMVKRSFAGHAREEKHPVTGAPLGKPEFVVLTRKPIAPAPEEVERNPRSRSAKLRVLERSAA